MHSSHLGHHASEPDVHTCVRAALGTTHVVDSAWSHPQLGLVECVLCVYCGVGVLYGNSRLGVNYGKRCTAEYAIKQHLRKQHGVGFGSVQKSKASEDPCCSTAQPASSSSAGPGSSTALCVVCKTDGYVTSFNTTSIRALWSRNGVTSSNAMAGAC